SQFINAGDTSGVDLLGGLAKALSFLPALGLLRIGKGSLSSAFYEHKQLGADFLFRNVASICAELLNLCMLAVAEPPDAAAYESEEDKADGEGEKDFVLPEVERPPQLGEFIAEALDLEVEVGVAAGDVVKVTVFLPFVAVGELQGAA